MEKLEFKVVQYGGDRDKVVVLKNLNDDGTRQATALLHTWATSIDIVRSDDRSDEDFITWNLVWGHPYTHRSRVQSGFEWYLNHYALSLVHEIKNNPLSELARVSWPM
jgi:hypothetical protein